MMEKGNKWICFSEVSGSL